MRIIDSVFSGSEASVVKKLWEDEESRLSLTRVIGERLARDRKLIATDPTIQVLSVLTQAKFVRAEEEYFEIAGMIRRHAKDTDILPLITEHQGRGLGERCLLGLGLFYDAMKERYIRRAAPKPDFYRKVGIETLRQAGVASVAENFRRWELFLQEVFN